MSNPPPPGNWNDPSWSSEPPTQIPDPTAQPGGYPAAQSGGYPTTQPVDYPTSYPQSGGYPAAQPAGYPTPGYPAYGYPPMSPAPQQNGLSVAALVVSIVALLGLCGYGLGGYLGIVGAVLGHVARRQIRERGETGDSMALAGVIMGWIATGVAVLATIAIVAFAVWIGNQDPSSFDSTTD